MAGGGGFAVRTGQRAAKPPAGAAWIFVAITVIGIGMLLGVPLAIVVAEAFADGPGVYFEALISEDTLGAAGLTLAAVAVAVPVNTVFGFAAAWLVAKYPLRAKNVWIAVIDLPFAISPVVAGLMIVLALGPYSALGRWLIDNGMFVIFAVPGVILATCFVTMPFVAREVIALMSRQGLDQEFAALSLGASLWQTIRWVTVPNVRWALVHGVILCTARAAGEFGAVSVVSGHIRGETTTLPLLVEMLHNEYSSSQAFSVATLLALVAVVALVAKTAVEHKLEASGPSAKENES